MKDFQMANTVVNGYFYSFTYRPAKVSKGYDINPFVFVVGPSTKSLKNFVGINLHHIPVQQRELFIRNFQRIYNFMDTNRTPLTEQQCSKLFSGITIALREYNREFVSNCVRIETNKVPLYIFGDGHVSQSTPNETAMKWLEQRGLYQSKEHNKK